MQIEDLAAQQIAKKQQQAEQNRRDFPLMASYLQKLAIFNPRAIWCEENGRTIGRKP